MGNSTFNRNHPNPATPMDEQISRRQFLMVSAAAASAVLATGGSALSGPLPERRKVLHLIGGAHIDAPWLWPWRDSADAVLTTWESAIDRMSETPGFCFSASAAQYYRWVREADPRLFAEISRRVQEGRWEAVGGWIVEPDCNLPSTESFIRQALLGKRYLRDALGVDVTVGFNPDSFGHARGLPTILAATGYRYYAFMRPSPQLAYEDVPAPFPKLFWWEGPDGARILAWWIQESYNLYPGKARDEPELFFPPGFNHGALVYGVGNHGGGPTRQHLALIQKMAADPTMPVEVRFSTWRDFFAAVEQEPAIKDLPVVRTDLQHIFRGCYSANGEAKWLNRRAERRLMTAETVSSVASMTLGWDYPVAAYDRAWWEVCFNQFHDSLAGSAMRSTYVDGRDGYGVSGALATETTVAAVEALSRHVDMSRVKEGSLLCFNPLPWPRTATIEVELDGGGPTAALKAEDGTAIPLQSREILHTWPPNFFLRYGARVALPACGYRVFELSRVNAAARPQPPSRVALGPEGGITGFATSEGTPLLASALGFVVVDDKSNAWGMKAPPSFGNELGRPTWISSKLTSDGPVRRIWTQKAAWRSSTITVELTETFDDDIFGITVFADWHEPEEILMLEIPTVLTPETHFAKAAGATITRRSTGDEEPGQDWVALEGDIGGARYTLALFNAQTYSYNCKGGRLRTVIVRSAPWTRDFENAPNQDIGFSVRRFGLMGSKGYALSLELERRALEFQTPLEYVADSVHPGAEPWERSFLEIAPGNVSATAIKHAEANENLIVRLQETGGTATEATIRSPMANWSHTVSLAPWSIVTLAIANAGSSRAVLSRVDALEQGVT